MYAVVSHYSFDMPDVALFESSQQAQRYLIDTAKNEYRIATEENGWDAELTFDAAEDEDIWSAKLVEHFKDHDDVTEFSIASLVHYNWTEAKLIVRVQRKYSDEQETELQTVSVYDNRSGTYWTEERICERGIQHFLDVKDLKETLNWNLNGNAKKYRFKWSKTDRGTVGTAYVFD